MRTAELKFPRVVRRLLFSMVSDAKWITRQETCAVKNCSGMCGRMPGTQAIDLSLLPIASKNQPHPRGGRNRLTSQIWTTFFPGLLVPVVYQQTTLVKIMPWVLVTAIQLSSFGWADILFHKSLHWQRYVQIKQIQVAWVHLCTFLYAFRCNNLGVGFCKTLLPVINSTISRTDAGIPAAEGAVLNKLFRFIA